MSLPAAARIRRTRAVPLLAAVVVALTVPVALLVPPQDASGATTAAPVPVPGASVGSPAGIAGRGGEVIVASGDGGDVLAVTGGRSRVLGGGMPRGRFANGPTGVALDRAGDVFVASADEGTVRVYRASGGSGVYASGLGSPIGLAFSDTGDLYVADAGGRRILRVSPDHRVFRVATGFAEMPYGLAFSPDGRLLVSTQRDGRVFRIATDGGRVAYGKTGGSAEGLVFDRSGRLYVGDGRSGKVVRIDRPGATATTVLSGQNGPINLGVSGSRSSALLVAVQQTRAKVTRDPVTGAVTSSQPDPAGNKVLSLPVERSLLAPQRPALAPTSVPFFAGNQAFRAGGVSLQPRTAVPVATRTDIGREAAEPTIGVTRKGNVFITAATFDGPAGRLARTELRGSFDRGKTFKDVTQRILGTDAPPATLDPFVFVDPTTDRIFNDDLTLACSNLAISDNEGTSFTDNPAACSFPVNDHQSITTGKPKVLTTIGYPNVVYFCGINMIAATTCSRSLDGGRTFVAGGPAYPGADPTSNNVVCGGLSGHTQTGPDGTVYVPRVFCDTPNVAISTDDGTTFQRVVVSKVKSQPFDHESGIALDGRGNAYYTYVAFDRLPRLVISRDSGRTWGKPLIINPPEVAQANLPAIAVSGPGQVTVSFYGSANRCCYQLDPKDPGNRENDQARWSTYVVTTSNALAASPTFYGVTVDPRTDPSVKRACGPGRCGNALDFLGVVIDNRHEVWSSSVDTCTPKAGSPTSGPGGGVVETRNCVTDPLAAQNNRRGIAAHFTLPAADAGSDYPMSPVIGGVPPNINPVIGAGPPRDRAPGTGTGTGTGTGDRGNLATTGLPGTLLLGASGLLLAAAGLVRLRRG